MKKFFSSKSAKGMVITMNLITCTEDCQYQKDGYCELCDTAMVNSTKVNGCSYYKKKKGKPKKYEIHL